MDMARLLVWRVSGLMALLLVVALSGLHLPGAAALTTARCPAGVLDLTQPNAIFHDGGTLYLAPTQPTAGEMVTFGLRTLACAATSATLVYRLTYPGDAHRVTMLRTGRDVTGRYDLWTARAHVGAVNSLLTYRFSVQPAQGGAPALWYGATGVSTTAYGAGRFAIVPGFSVPTWAESAIYYQIFPDRFKDGNPANNVRTGEYLYQGQPVQAMPWNGLPISPSCSCDFFGGDLAGIAQEITPYLKQTLGVTALYMTPIFQSLSNHKYDTQDYFKVDPHFGSNADLVHLVQTAHASSTYPGDYPLHVVLDGVFNHTGDSIRWFNKEGLYPTVGAYNSQKSPYFSYYTFTNWPDQYVDFNNCCPTLPVLNYHTAAVRQVIYQGAQSVVKTYLKPPYAIDGWRLDVADQAGGDLNTQVMQGIRQAARSVNPQSVIIGETWGAAAQWLDGTQWDAAMNYNGFGFPISEWLTGQDMMATTNSTVPSALDATMAQYRNSLPRPAQLAMMNSLSTHDTPRFLTRANGNVRRMLLAVEMQMTSVGDPMLYYGDEIGMMGGPDPDNRRPFDWNKAAWNMSILHTYQRLIVARRAISALRTGSMTALVTDDAHNVYAYGRWDAHGRALVAMNNDGKGHTVTLDATTVEGRPGSSWTNAVTGAVLREDVSGRLVLPLAAVSGVVLVQQ